MNLIEAIKFYEAIQTPSEEESEEALEYLMKEPIKDFCKSNIESEDVQDLALADESFTKRCADLHDINLDLLSPDKTAYHLAYTNPELGSAVLDELLYYRKLGRI